jgi:tRNA(Ile)-lysidine synthase
MRSLRAFERRFLEFARRRCRLGRGARVVVAVSGGPDSVALLTLLARHKDAQGWKIHAAHFNHRVRGRASDRDEAFVRRLCRDLKIPLKLGHRRLTKRAGPPARAASLNEEHLREMRIKFLMRAARSLRATHVALGHQRNDVAETFLMRLLRGAGADGLAVLPPRTGREELLWVRPLLPFPRSEIEAWLRLKKIPWREDLTNRRVDRFRNRIRHELLPLLARRYNPRVVEELARAAEILREENSYMESQSARAVSEKKISLTHLRRAPLALRRRMVRRAIAEAKGDLRRITFAHVESILNLLEGGHEAHLPDWLTVSRNGRFLHFRSHDVSRPTSQTKRPPRRPRVRQGSR